MTYYLVVIPKKSWTKIMRARKMMSAEPFGNPYDDLVAYGDSKTIPMRIGRVSAISKGKYYKIVFMLDFWRGMPWSFPFISIGIRKIVSK